MNTLPSAVLRALTMPSWQARLLLEAERREAERRVLRKTGPLPRQRKGRKRLRKKRGLLW